MSEQPVEKLFTEAAALSGWCPSSEFAKAWIVAQKNMEHATQSGTNKFLKSDAHPNGTPYSTLKDVVDAVRGALNEAGIGYTQKIKQKNANILCKTIFFHESGEGMETDWSPVPVEKPTAHGFGTAYTYARRYSLAMACGISADPDLDGNVETPKRTGVMAALIEDGLDVDEAKVQDWVEYLDNDVFTIEGEGRAAKLECLVPEEKMRKILDRLNAGGHDLKIAVLDKMGSKVRSYIASMEKS